MGIKKHQKLIVLKRTQKYLKIVPQNSRKLQSHSLTGIREYGHTRTLEYNVTWLLGHMWLKIIIDNWDKIWYDSVYTMGRADTWVGCLG